MLLTIDGVRLELTASEGFLQRLASALMYGSQKHLDADTWWQQALEGPLEFGSVPPTVAASAPTAPPSTGAKDEALALLRDYVQQHGPEFAKNLLHEFGVERVSELDAAGLEGLTAALKQSLPRRK